MKPSGGSPHSERTSLIMKVEDINSDPFTLAPKGKNVIFLASSPKRADQKLADVVRSLERRGIPYVVRPATRSVEAQEVTLYVFSLDDDPGKTYGQEFAAGLYSLECEYDPRFTEWKREITPLIR